MVRKFLVNLGADNFARAFRRQLRGSRNQNIHITISVAAMSLLEVKNLTKTFDGITAVDDVSFTVPQGAIYGLIGRNGAGKTTTIRMIMNIFLPDSGEIIFQGAKAGREFQERTGYLPEDRGLYKKLKVLETILFFAELKNKRGRDVELRAIDYLKRFELFDRRNSKIQDLSKGNQQKVQFISTIIHDPDFIILDEPFSGLDPVNTNLLKEIILDFKRKGKVIIFSTHLMEFAEKICDEVIMIDKGKLVLSGSLRDIKKSYSQRNITLIHDGDIAFLKDSPLVESLVDLGNSTGIRVKHENDIQEVLKLLVERGIGIQSFIANDISLQEIFISLVGAEALPAEERKN
jgi:ABC-2 type transport system ATP-binding protein